MERIKMKKVSVVIPVYNKEKYLRRCLDSLLKQTLQEIEVLVINDGSTDGSEDIIKEYVQKYPEKIYGFSKPNGGLSDTRNFGIAKAHGEYIAFIDSDDFVLETMLEEMYQKAKEKDFDVVACNVMLVYPDKKLEVETGVTEGISLTLEEKKRILLESYPIVCNKLYRTQMLQDKVFFKKNIWFEDVVFMFDVVPNLSSIGVVEKPFYQYIQNTDSITHTYNEKLYDFIYNMDGIIEQYKARGIYEEYRDVIEYAYVRYSYATFIKRLAKGKCKKEFWKGVKFARKKVQQKFPNYRQNKYMLEKTNKNWYLRHFNPCVANIIYYVERNKMN